MNSSIRKHRIFPLAAANDDMGRQRLAGALEQPVAARYQERADQDGVDQDSDHECKAELAERCQAG